MISFSDLLHGGPLAVGGEVLGLVLLPQQVDVDEDGPLLEVHHRGVVREVEPVVGCSISE